MRKQIEKNGSWDSTIYYPTNILSFQSTGYHQREWKDGKKQIEQQLSNIIAQMELSASERTRIPKELRKSENERREKERLQKEFQLNQERELAAFNETLSKSARWHEANNLRLYIDEVEMDASNKGVISSDLMTG